MLSKEALVAYVVSQYMDDKNNPIGQLSENAVDTDWGVHRKEVSKLADLALSCGANRKEVEKVSGG